jgi:branched-chain amino acid transport system ATP-binding protein
LLLLDEPSLGLAPVVIDLVFDVLAELRDEGVTILLVEQNAARTVELADRSYVLRTGEVALSGDRDQLAGAAHLETAFLGL